MNGTLSLEAVSLQDLVSQAELLTRVDRKYLLREHSARAILDSAAEGARVLEIAGRREFAYDSVYFDTPDHLSYRLTAQRRRRRFKLRTRSYLDTGTAVSYTHLDVYKRQSPTSSVCAAKTCKTWMSWWPVISAS